MFIPASITSESGIVIWIRTSYGIISDSLQWISVSSKSSTSVFRPTCCGRRSSFTFRGYTSCSLGFRTNFSRCRCSRVVFMCS